MTILDRQNYLNEIEENGICATDKYAERKIKDYMTNLCVSTKYHKSKIIQMTKEVAQDYYAALPDEIAKKQLVALYETARATKKNENAEKKIITLYESEMQTIAELKDDKLMRLAFAALVLHKFKGMYENQSNCHRAIAACETDVYKMADLSSICNSRKSKLWNELCRKDLIHFWVNTNRAYRFNRDWIAIPMMTVTFNVDIKPDKTNERVFAQIENYENILLWLKLWQERKIKHKTLIRCSDCGCPIEKKTKSVCLCNSCANKRKKASDNVRYKKKSA